MCKEKNITPNENYLFLYLLGNEIDVDIKKIFDYAECLELKVVYVASQGRFDNFEKEYPGVTREIINNN